MHAAHRPGELGVDDAILVRHYAWDVAAYSDAVEHGTGEAVLAATPRTLLLGRHRRASTLVVLTPSLAALIAMAVASGRRPALPAGLTASVVEDEARDLEARGLFPEGTALHIHEELA